MAFIPLALAVVAIYRAEQAYQHSTTQAGRVDANTARIAKIENGTTRE